MYSAVMTGHDHGRHSQGNRLHRPDPQQVTDPDRRARVQRRAVAGASELMAPWNFQAVAHAAREVHSTVRWPGAWAWADSVFVVDLTWRQFRLSCYGPLISRHGTGKPLVAGLRRLRCRRGFAAAGGADRRATLWPPSRSAGGRR